MLQKYRIISKSKKRSCPKRKQNTNYAKKNANFRKSYTIVIQNNIEYQNYCICVNLREYSVQNVWSRKRTQRSQSKTFLCALCVLSRQKIRVIRAIRGRRIWSSHDPRIPAVPLRHHRNPELPRGGGAFTPFPAGDQPAAQGAGAGGGASVDRPDVGRANAHGRAALCPGAGHPPGGGEPVPRGGGF